LVALPGVLMMRAFGCGIGSGTGMKVSPGAAMAPDIPAAHATVRTRAKAVPAFILYRSLRIAADSTNSEPRMPSHRRRTCGLMEFLDFFS
jgi:hypothetical protein